MAVNTLKVDPVQLRAARQEFEGYMAQVETIRQRVDGAMRGVGTGWYGDARRAYDNTIDQWVADYQKTVEVPLNQLLAWLGNAIQVLEQAEQSNVVRS